VSETNPLGMLHDRFTMGFHHGEWRLLDDVTGLVFGSIPNPDAACDLADELHEIAVRGSGYNALRKRFPPVDRDGA
jgi:hypothetical protein